MREMLASLTLIVDIIAVLTLSMTLASQRFDRHPALTKIALAVITIGMLGQIAKQLIVLFEGQAAADRHWPWWMLKDWGVALLAVALLCRGRFFRWLSAMLIRWMEVHDRCPHRLIPPRAFDRATMIAELVRDEGERLKVYRCTAGKLTIGVGRNLDDVGLTEAERIALGGDIATLVRLGISREGSRLLLDNDITRVERDLDRHLSWWRTLDPTRQRVMVNMAFNLGIKGLLGFRNTLAMIRTGRYGAASINMLLSKWARQVGARAKRLSQLMKNGAA